MPNLPPVENGAVHLLARLSIDPRVGTGEKGGPLRRHIWQAHRNRARRKVDLPKGFRFHDLRHTANTITAASGASTRELMHRMGHSSQPAR